VRKATDEARHDKEHQRQIGPLRDDQLAGRAITEKPVNGSANGGHVPLIVAERGLA
jgi:hypothetical protein